MMMMMMMMMINVSTRVITSLVADGIEEVVKLPRGGHAIVQ